MFAYFKRKARLFWVCYDCWLLTWCLLWSFYDRNKLEEKSINILEEIVK